jgi:hypothetical protein
MSGSGLLAHRSICDFARQKRVCRCENRPTGGRQVSSYKCCNRVRLLQPESTGSGWACHFGRTRSNGLCVGDPIKLRGRNSVITAIRVSFPLRVALAVSASVRSGPDQAPAGWKSGTERGTDIHVVVEVPDCRPARDYIVK